MPAVTTIRRGSPLKAGKSFIGSYVLGMGFTFDDTDRKGAASPLAEMHRLIEKNPRNAERIFPYIGGEEVNTSPTQSHHRYVISFEDFPLERADLGATWQAASAGQRQAWLRAGVVPWMIPIRSPPIDRICWRSSGSGEANQRRR